MQQPPRDVSIKVLLFSMLKVAVEFFLESTFDLDDTWRPVLVFLRVGKAPTGSFICVKKPPDKCIT